MRIIKHPSPTEVVVEKIYPSDELQKFEKEILNAKCRETNIPGFRPGFAPLEKVREKLLASGDWEALMGSKVQEKIINDWTKEKDEELGEIVKILDVKSTKSQPLTLECHFEYFPRLKETDVADKYLNLKVTVGNKATEIKIIDEEIETGLNEIQQRRTILKPVQEVLGKDRLAFIKITPADGGPEDAEKKENKDLFQWGIKQQGEEFDQATEGMKEGDEKTLADGRKVKVEKVFVSQAPELNDEFAKSLGHFHTMADLKTNLKEGLLMEKLYAELEARREALIKALLEAIEIAVPQSIVERTARNYKKNFEQQLGNMGKVDKDIAEEKIKKLEKVFEEKALRELKLQRILEAIALKEKIVPTDEEVEKEVKNILGSFKKPKEAYEALGSPETLKSRVTLSLCFDKTLKFLEKKNNVTTDIQEKLDQLEKEHEKNHHHHNHDHHE
jgi:trigger factor